MALFNGNNYTLADFLANGGFGYAEIWDQFWSDVLAELTARSSGVGGSATAAANSAAAALLSANSANADRLLSEAARIAVQSLLAQTQAARDGAAADRVLAQQYVGTATNVLIAALNNRLASAWDANGQPTQYALTGVVATGVYDTSKDPDGGRWCKGRLARTTGWYNEPLNTATRGAKRRFPAVAPWVLTTSNLIIYDQNDLDANGSPRMWAVCAGGAGGVVPIASVLSPSSACARAGRFLIGLSAGAVEIDLLRDAVYRYTADNTTFKAYRGRFADRSLSVSTEQRGPAITAGLASNTVNSVDLRVMQGAPVDPVTRLPVPTVLACTVGGASVVHPTGLVANITGYAGTVVKKGLFIDDSTIRVCNTTGAVIDSRIPYANTTDTASRVAVYAWNGTPALTVYPPASEWAAVTKNAVGGGGALVLIDRDAGNPANGMTAAVTKDFATGWMPGDTRGAAICEGAGTNGASGADAVLNGDFSAGTNNWAGLSGAEAATISVVSGALRVTPASSFGGGGQTISTVIGQQYTLAVDVIAVAGTMAGVRIRDSGGDIVTTTDSATLGRRYSSFVARQTTTNICVFAFGGTADFDNVSCRKTGTFSDAVTGSGELIVNGDGSSTAGWTALNGATLSAVGGELVLTRGSAEWFGASQAITCVVGQTYSLAATIPSKTYPGAVRICVGNAAGASEALFDDSSATGVRLLRFTATAATQYVSVLGATGGATGQTINVDNVSCKLAVPDRSYKGKSLVVNGTLTRTPVAPGSDLYVLSGFSPNNYAEQPYNPDFDFGTGDFCVFGWLFPDTGNTTFITRTPDGNFAAGSWSIQKSSGNLVFSISNAATLTGSALPTDTTTPVFVLVGRRAGVWELWRDDRLDASSSTGGTTSVSVTNAVTRIGTDATKTATSVGARAGLFRIAAYMPTPAQIKRMFADERAAIAGKMFLGGVSNNVQGLALDEDTGVLNVATADGVDQFAGLRRAGRIAANTQGIGAERVANGNYASTSNWTGAVGSLSVSGGVGTITAAGAWGGAYQSITGLTPGKTYILTAEIAAGTAAAWLTWQDGAYPSSSPSSVENSSTTFAPVSLKITPTGSQIALLISIKNGAAGQTAFFRNVSFKELGALSAVSVSSVAAGGGTVLVGTANEAGVVSDLMPIKDELRQAPAANSNDIVFETSTNGAAPAVLGKLFVAEGESLLVDIEVQGIEASLTPSVACSYSIKGRVQRAYGGNVTLPTSPFKVILDSTNTALDVSLTADTATNAASLNVTGLIGKNMVWRGTARINRIGGVNAAA